MSASEYFYSNLQSGTNKLDTLLVKTSNYGENRLQSPSSGNYPSRGLHNYHGTINVGFFQKGHHLSTSQFKWGPADYSRPEVRRHSTDNGELPFCRNLGKSLQLLLVDNTSFQGEEGYDWDGRTRLSALIEGQTRKRSSIIPQFIIYGRRERGRKRERETTSQSVNFNIIIIENRGRNNWGRGDNQTGDGVVVLY